jgi:UDP-2,3-diacylglucosamine pyrophosphatase LpxH
MITTVSEERLLVVSDVHLGNRLFHARQPFVDFLRYARTHAYNLCINGDGIDIIQTTLTQISRDMSECSGEIRKFARDGLRVYYTVGNHDIVLEHFLDDWEILRLVPFLNVLSGDTRIRIEHGHLYDASFVNFPRMYTAATVLGGMALRIHPSVYKALKHTKFVVEKLGRLIVPPDTSIDRADIKETIPNEPLMFIERADEISRHGFNAVIFGHTHCWGQVRLSSGATYVNTGCWLFEPQYAEINQGQVTLKRVADCLAEPHLEPEVPSKELASAN